tara:strand:+ start:257 stop:514 length:258 start_codon:yes stop_codon:yes gene_type:complete
MKYRKNSYNKKKGFKRKEKQMRGLCVEVYNNNIEGALKVFKKKVKESGLFLDLKKKEYYVKPSELKKERKHRGKVRSFNRQRKNN